MQPQTITRTELADLVQHHADLFARALRGEPQHSDRELADDRRGVAVSGTHTAPAPDPSSSPDPTAAEIGSAGDAAAAGPRSWTSVGELPNETYTWPEGTEHYQPFEIWETTDGRGRVQIGLGRPVERGDYYGKTDVGWWLAFEMINRQKRRPIVVFNEADDFETTGDLVAIIKGKGAGGRSMFAPGDELPAGYERLSIDVFRDRISGPQAFNRLAVIAEGGDRQAMCEHAFLQLRLRF